MRNDQYEFIPVKSDPNNQLVDLVDFTDDKHHTGYLKCSLYVLNHLLVGNAHKTDKQGITTIDPLEISEKIHISPYTLKGCISSFIAQLLGIPLSRINPIRYNKKGFNYIKLSENELLLKQEGYQPFLKGELSDPHSPQLTVLKSMFGYSLSDKDKQYLELTNNDKDNWQDFMAKAGKVHFNYACHVSQTGKETNTKLPLAGAPAATRDYFKTVSEQRIKLRGRKVYKRYDTTPSVYNNKWVRLNRVLSYDDVKISYPCLRFTCHYENLLEEELELLLFALHLGQPTFDSHKKLSAQTGLRCHQIGYGKNFGMGAVKIVVDKVVPAVKLDLRKYETLLTKKRNKLLKNLIFDPTKKQRVI